MFSTQISFDEAYITAFRFRQEIGQVPERKNEANHSGNGINRLYSLDIIKSNRRKDHTIYIYIYIYTEAFEENHLGNSMKLLLLS